MRDTLLRNENLSVGHFGECHIVSVRPCHPKSNKPGSGSVKLLRKSQNSESELTCHMMIAALPLPALSSDLSVSEPPHVSCLSNVSDLASDGHKSE